MSFLGLVVNLSVFEARPLGLQAARRYNEFDPRPVDRSRRILAMIFPARTSDWLDLTASYLGVTFFSWLIVQLKQK